MPRLFFTASTPGWPSNVVTPARNVLSESGLAFSQEPGPPELASGLTPTEAAKAMTVPEGFRVKLAAGEPMVHQPIAFAIDHRGRLWVAEAYTYPNRAADGRGLRQGRGRGAAGAWTR